MRGIYHWPEPSWWFFTCSQVSSSHLLGIRSTSNASLSGIFLYMHCLFFVHIYQTTFCLRYFCLPFGFFTWLIIGKTLYLLWFCTLLVQSINIQYNTISYDIDESEHFLEKTYSCCIHLPCQAIDVFLLKSYWWKIRIKPVVFWKISEILCDWIKVIFKTDFTFYFESAKKR